MNYDDPKLTAYALGEVDEAIGLDDDASRIVEETALIAGVLREHYRGSRRRLRVARYAMAAVVLIAALLVFSYSRRPAAPRSVAMVPAQQPVAQVQMNRAQILSLTPSFSETAEASSLMNADFRGIHAVDVEQLVAVVIRDASRVGTFTSLRLTSEADVMFQ